MFSEYVKPLKGLAPSSDIFNGAPATDVFNMKDLERISFYVYHKGGTTGVGTLTIEECKTIEGGTPTAIPFKYRRMVTGDSDELGAISLAEVAGIDTVAAEDTIIEIEVSARDLDEGFSFVRLQTAEKVNDPVAGAVLAFGTCARYKGASMPSAIVS